MAPSDGALRTRLTHTLEVAAMATEIAAALDLDVDLAGSIALAHDIGHPAFGHAGERALAQVSGVGFHHAAHGVRVLTALSPRGFVVSDAVLAGVLRHSKGRSGSTFAKGRLAETSIEALVVRAADLYAYAWHDLEDAYELGLVHPDDLPSDVRRVVGPDPREIRDRLVRGTIAASSARDIGLVGELATALEQLRAHLYEHLYESWLLARQTDTARRVIERLFACYLRDEEGVLAASGRTITPSDDARQRAVDLVASLGDREALDLDARLSAIGIAA